MGLPDNDIKHNWLYSVVPLFPEPLGIAGGIYLAGYCKNCRSGFTVKMKVSQSIGHILIDKLDIPVMGCEGE